jgi:hypothetical protein
MSALALMFSYLDGIYAVRNSTFARINDPRTVIADSPLSVHKLLLTSLNKSAKNALIYNNEISLVRELGDISDNEIKMFLSTFNDWDILVLSPYKDSDLVDVPDYTIVKKAKESLDFSDKHIYIASKQFMTKVENNNISDLKVYVYSNPFLKLMYENAVSSSDKYLVSQVIELDSASATRLAYKWQPIFL